MKAYKPSKVAPEVAALFLQSQESDRIAANLSGAVSAGASSQDVAEAVATIFMGIEDALVPIVGERGIAALYKRTLHLTQQVHAGLPALQPGLPTGMDLGALTAALSQQPAAAAAATGAALLQTFHQLLASLLGPSLTERLLRLVWATFLSGPSAEDSTR